MSEDPNPDEDPAGPDGPEGEDPAGTDDPGDEESSGDEEYVGRHRPDWTDRIVGDRMAVDQEFAPRVANSEFTSQEWGLIMTATEFRIRHPADAERAELVADASKVEHVAGELDDIRQSMGSMGAPGGSPSGSRGSGDHSGGLLGSIKSALGMGGSGNVGGRDPDEVVAQAESLTAEYAELLQARLETREKWDEIRDIAAEGNE